MNKTITINLAGVLFHIDQEAYDLLQNYLRDINHYLSDNKAEILSDIESRICELLLNKQKNSKQIVTLLNVQEIIQTMGNPQDYELDDTPPPSSENKTSATAKKLYRDADHSIFGGVCAGLSHYIGAKAIVIRALYILLAIFSFGITVVVYIILWSLIPKARTTAEKLSMKGKPVDLHHISNVIRDDINDGIKMGKQHLDKEIKTGKKNFSRWAAWLKSKKKDFAKVNIFQPLSRVLTILGKIIGFLIIIISSLLLISIVVSLFSFHYFLDILINLFLLANNPESLIISSLLVFIGVPLLLLFLWGLYLISNHIRPLNKFVLLALILFWITSVVSISVMTTQEIYQRSREGVNIQEDQWNITTSDTLTIGSDSEYLYTPNFPKQITDDLWEIRKRISLHILPSELKFHNDLSSNLQIRIEKYSRARTITDATDYAKQIPYQYRLSDNNLYLPSVHIINSKGKYHNQRLRIILNIPEKTPFRLDKSLRKTLNDCHFFNDEHYQDSDEYWHHDCKEVYYHLWMFVKNKLVCLDCTTETD